MKAFIDPRCDIRYAAFYIYGLYQTLGKHNEKISGQYYRQVPIDETD